MSTAFVRSLIVSFLLLVAQVSGARAASFDVANTQATPTPTPPGEQSFGGSISNYRQSNPPDITGSNPLSAGGGTGGRGEYDARQSNPIELIAPMWHYWVLIGAILLLSLSVFLFMQSNELQGFAFRRLKTAPNPRSGEILVYGSIVVIIISLGVLSFLQYLAKYPPPGPYPLHEGENGLTYVFRLFPQDHSRAAESPFGEDWEYLSRPFNQWALKRTVKRYMEYVMHLINTL